MYNHYNMLCFLTFTRLIRRILYYCISDTVKFFLHLLHDHVPKLCKIPHGVELQHHFPSSPFGFLELSRNLSFKLDPHQASIDFHVHKIGVGRKAEENRAQNF